MIDLILSRFAFQLRYIEALVADIPDERMAEQPAPGLNTPAWLLGHLSWAADFVPALLGKKPTLDDGWTKIYGAWSKPIPERSLYAPKDVLVATLKEAHARAAEAAKRVTPEQLAAELPNADFRALLPTIGDGLVHILTTHEATHTGQLSVWRRLVGLSPWKDNMFA